MRTSRSNAIESAIATPAMVSNKIYYVMFRIESYAGNGLFMGATKSPDGPPQSQASAGWHYSPRHGSHTSKGAFTNINSWPGWQSGKTYLMKFDFRSPSSSATLHSVKVDVKAALERPDAWT